MPWYETRPTAIIGWGVWLRAPCHAIHNCVDPLVSTVTNFSSLCSDASAYRLPNLHTAPVSARSGSFLFCCTMRVPCVRELVLYDSLVRTSGRTSSYSRVIILQALLLRFQVPFVCSWSRNNYSFFVLVPQG